MNKLRTLLLRPRLRNILGQARSTVDLRAALDERRVVLVKLSTGSLGADAAHLLGALIIGRLWQAIRQRRKRDTASVYIDEFQDVLHLPTDLGSVLAQSRSYGVGLTLAYQHLGQLTPEIRSAVLANARSRVVFQTGADDARVLAKVVGGGLAPDDLMGLPAFEAYTQLFAAGVTQPPASMRTEPLPSPAGHARTLRQRSRARYGRPLHEVEADLRARVERAPTSGPIGRKRRSP